MNQCQILIRIINKRIKEGYLKYLLKRKKMTVYEPQCLQTGYIT